LRITEVSKPPTQKPSTSRQDYATPAEFINAVKGLLGITDFAIDLAADESNTVCEKYYTIEYDSLKRTGDWKADGWCWLNPPFGQCRTWVKKAYEESQDGAGIAVLAPASVGSNWWRDWVHGKCHVLFVNGRIVFVGHTSPYPKDCALLLYSRSMAPAYSIWTW